jgi:hypothetical protein
MPTLRRCGAVKPRSPKGAPKAQGLTAPHRRRTIADAVNREAMYVITSARPLPPLCVQIFFIITLSLPIPQKTRCAEHAVKSGQANCTLQPSATKLATRTSDLIGAVVFERSFYMTASFLDLTANEPRGACPIGRCEMLAPQPCIRWNPLDPDHDAAMRIGGEAPG